MMDNNQIETYLAAKGVKATVNRILIARELLGASHPLSLADLETALDPMDKASIFRTLELFAKNEIVHVIEDGSRSLKYEICHGHDRHSIYDQHVHFYCECCKETFCLEDINIPVVDVPSGFTPRSVNYMLKGICPRCSAKAGN